MSNFIKEFLDNSVSKKELVELENNKIKANDNNFKKNNSKNMWKIEIKKQSYKKLIIWIIIQFIVWFFLIAVSWSYLQKNEAERKFFDSSIQYWKNIAVNIYSKFWSEAENQVDKVYIKKRQNMVVELNNLNIKLDKCIAKETDKNTLKQLKKLKLDILWFKRILENIDELSMSEFVSRNQYYSLWLNSFKNGIDNYCK